MRGKLVNDERTPQEPERAIGLAPTALNRIETGTGSARHFLITFFQYIHLPTSLILVLAAVIQTVTFVLLARNFGVSRFGALMMLQASTQSVLDFVTIGSGDAIVRRIARKSGDHGVAVGHAITVMATTIVPMSAAIGVFVLYCLKLPISHFGIWLYVVGELLGNSLATVTEQTCIAHSDVASANAARLAPAALRCLAVIAFVVGQKDDINLWICIQGFLTLLGGIAVFSLLVLRRFGWPILGISRSDLSFGTTCTFLRLTSALQFNADRLVLGGLLSASVVGLYSAATRGLQFGTLPVLGVLRNLQSGFFRAGREGLEGARSFARANIRRVVVVGLLSAAGILGAAGLLPWILGRGFESSGIVLRYLCLSPLLQGLQYLFADVLTCSERQKTRLAVSLLAVGAYILVIVTATRNYGLAGLVIGLYVFQILSIGMYFFVGGMGKGARVGPE